MGGAQVETQDAGIEGVDFCADSPICFTLVNMVGGLRVLEGLPATARLRYSLRSVELVYLMDSIPYPDKVPCDMFNIPWSSLEELKLRYFPFSFADAAALSAANQLGHFPRLRKLYLAYCLFAEGSWEALCLAPFEAVEELTLYGASVDHNALAHSTISFPNLRMICMPGYNIYQLEHILDADLPECLERVTFRLPQQPQHGIHQQLTPIGWSNIKAPRWEAVIAEDSSDNTLEYLRPKY